MPALGAAAEGGTPTQTDGATGAYGARASRDTRCPPRHERQRVSSEEGVPRGSARGGSPGGPPPR